MIWLVSGVALMVASVTPATLYAEESSAAIQSIRIGFDGKVVLGRWVPFSVSFADAPSAADQSLEIETLDGDAVPIRYTQDLTGSKTASGLIRIGRAAAITVRLKNKSDGLINIERRFSLDELAASHSFLPGTTKLTLVLGVDQAEKLEFLIPDRSLSDELASVADFASLPDRWIGMDSVRTVIVAPLSSQSAVSQIQSAALEQWVRMGGQLLLTGGPSAGQFYGESGSFGALAPGPFLRQENISETGVLELLVATTDPLVIPTGTPLTVSVLDVPATTSVRTTAGTLPLLIHRSVGFGRITFAGVDFTETPLAEWPGRRRLLSVALSDKVSRQIEDEDTPSGRVSHIGYSDMAGQLRAGMDQFRNVSFITFTSVALLVTLFILAIGPGDYLFLRRVATGRMELTWLTFTALSLAFCGLAYWIAATAKSSNTEMNQVELIDIDSRDGLIRGTIWTHLYSPNTGAYELAMPETNTLVGDISDRWLSWQGLPGRGLGSMLSRTDLGLYRRAYGCDVRPGESGLNSVPLQNASTKTLFARWKGQLAGTASSNLRQSPTSDALLGTFNNPLDVELFDCVLLYGDWVYVLENRSLNAGETIVVEDDLREKTVTGHFTRLGGLGQDEVNSAWDPSGTSLARILQMMGFFDAVGGEIYTRLTNDFHPEIDLSHQLRMGHAILIGQIPQVTTPMTVNGETFQDYDRKLSMVRVVFPVQPKKPRSRGR